jgi:hypothetical protein
MNKAMIKGSHKKSSLKRKVGLKSFTKESCDLNDYLDLPSDIEDTTAIISEMTAQKAVFDAAFSVTPNLERVRSCAESTLKLLPHDPERIETRLLVFCLNYCIGNIRTDLIPEKTSKKRWSQKVFEALSIGWMRWMADQNDDGVLYYIEHMHNDEPKEEDKSLSTLILNFWAKAIELMVLNKPSESKKFFEKANEVGAQIGTSINPSICWTYAMSFYRIKIR